MIEILGVSIFDPEAEQAKREALEAEERKRRQAGVLRLLWDAMGNVVTSLES